MNYLQWNNLLAESIFNSKNENKEVFLYLNKSDIIQIAADSQFNSYFINLLEEGEDLHGLIWNEFCDAVKNGMSFCNSYKPICKSECDFIRAIRNNKKIDFSKKDILFNAVCASEQWKTRELAVVRNQDMKVNGVQIKYPFYIAYLILLILPLTENEDEFNASNYYDRLNDFLSSNGISRINAKKIGTSHFKEVDFLWNELKYWANSLLNGSLGVFNVKIIGAHQFVGKPFAECILTAKQREKIPLIFSEADLQVGDSLSYQELESMLITWGKSILKYRDAKWDVIIKNKDLKDILISSIKGAYSLWDGRTSIIESKENLSSERETTFNLHLSLEYDEVQERLQDLKFRLYTNRPDEIAENYCFKFKNDFLNENDRIDFYPNGWSKIKICIPEKITSILCNKVSFHDIQNNVKAIFLNKEIYLFENKYGLNDYVSKAVLDTRGEYLILFSHQVRGVVEEWIFTCGAYENLSHYENIPEGWMLFKIVNPRISCEGINMLSLPDSVTLEKIEGIKVGPNEFLNLFPLRFYFLGVREAENVCISFDNGSDLQLTFVKDLNCWELGSDDLVLDIPFNLKTTGYTSNKKYLIKGAFIQEDHPEMRIDSFGSIDNIGTGIKKILIGLGASNPDNRKITNEQHFNFNLDSNISIEKLVGCYTENDNLLYSLSSKGLFDKDFFLLSFLSFRRYTHKFNFDILSKSLALYDQLGYLNYSYDKKKGHIITVNKPSLMQIPKVHLNNNSYYEVFLTGARTVELIQQIIAYCNGKDVFIDFSRNHPNDMCEKYMLPQSVFIKAKDKKEFEKLSLCLNIDYQPQYIYQLNLLDFCSDILEFEERLEEFKIHWQDYLITKEQYNYDTFKKERTNLHVDTNLSFVEYYPGSYKSKCILWRNNIAYEVEKSWGHYYMMYKLGKIRLEYDNTTLALKVPNCFRLPKLYARVFALCVGLAPEEHWEEGVLYNLYKISNIMAHNILLKLKQTKNRYV